MKISEAYPHLKTIALAYGLKLNNAKDFKFARIILVKNLNEFGCFLWAICKPPTFIITLSLYINNFVYGIIITL